MASTGSTTQYLDFGGKAKEIISRPRYPAYEIEEQHASLSKEERFELKQQQKAFGITVYTREDAAVKDRVIGDYHRCVPYTGTPGAYGKQKRNQLNRESRVDDHSIDVH